MNSSKRRLLVGGLLSMGALLTGSAIRAAESSKKQGKKKERVIKIQAQKFSYTPSEITLKKGEAVVLELTSTDFAHGFNLPEFGIRSDIPPGKVTKLMFTPDKEGEFEFLCDNFCGSGHEEMSGKFIVKA